MCSEKEISYKEDTDRNTRPFNWTHEGQKMQLRLKNKNTKHNLHFLKLMTLRKC